MGFSDEAKTWAQKIQDAAKAAVEKARGRRRQDAPTEVPTEAPAKAPEVAEVPAEAEVSAELPVARTVEVPVNDDAETAGAAEDIPAEVPEAIGVADVEAAEGPKEPQ
jgi:hypothetical protein